MNNAHEWKDCPLCGRWDCECQDILTEDEYKRLVGDIVGGE